MRSPSGGRGALQETLSRSAAENNDLIARTSLTRAIVVRATSATTTSRSSIAASVILVLIVVVKVVIVVIPVIVVIVPVVVVVVPVVSSCHLLLLSPLVGPGPIVGATIGNPMRLATLYLAAERMPAAGARLADHVDVHVTTIGEANRSDLFDSPAGSQRRIGRHGRMVTD